MSENDGRSIDVYPMEHKQRLLRHHGDVENNFIDEHSEASRTFTSTSGFFGFGSNDIVSFRLRTPGKQV